MLPRILQTTDLASSSYERPTLHWRCGLADEGRACPSGPDPEGRCVALAECHPQRKGDRWQCTRSAARGGACREGPFEEGGCAHPMAPCQPQPSLRSSRGAAVKWALVGMVGLLFFFIGGEDRLRFVSPGPLHHKHGAVTGGCAACHAAADSGAAGWLRLAFAGRGGDLQADRCLSCHTLGPRAAQPHSLGADALTIRTARLERTVRGGGEPLRLELASRVARLGAPSHGSPSCGACHREHQGRTAALTSLGDTQCQVCHAAKFARFDAGHPPFSGFPHRRRTRIVFDHRSHRDQHYSKEGASFVCDACHRPDPAGQRMLLHPFEAACAACHRKQITGSQTPFIAVPELDLAVLGERGIRIGEWPEWADEPLTPFMRLLLARDPQGHRDLRLFDGLPDPAALGDATPSELAAVARVAWAVKRLLLDLSADGHLVLERLRSAGAEPQLSNLAGRLPAETVIAAVSSWFPSLRAEVAALEESQPPDTRGVKLGELGPFELDPDTWIASGGWVRADEALHYRPGAHGDRFMVAWLDAAASARSPQGALPFDQLAESDAGAACVKCHSRDALDPAQPEAGVRVNWQPYREGADPRPFTRYLHEPHFSTGQAGVCLECHVISETAETAESYEQQDPTRFESGFEPMTVETCSSCHQRAAAATTCRTCHLYHVVLAATQ